MFSIQSSSNGLSFSERDCPCNNRITPYYVPTTPGSGSSRNLATTSTCTNTHNHSFLKSSTQPYITQERYTTSHTLFYVQDIQHDGRRLTNTRRIPPPTPNNRILHAMQMAPPRCLRMLSFLPTRSSQCNIAIGLTNLLISYSMHKNSSPHSQQGWAKSHCSLPQAGRLWLRFSTVMTSKYCGIGK